MVFSVEGKVVDTTAKSWKDREGKEHVTNYVKVKQRLEYEMFELPDDVDVTIGQTYLMELNYKRTYREETKGNVIRWTVLSVEAVV